MGYDPFACDVYSLFSLRLDGCGQRFAAWTWPLGQADAGCHDGGVRTACGMGVLGVAVKPFHGNAFCIISGFVDTGNNHKRLNVILYFAAACKISNAVSLCRLPYRQPPKTSKTCLFSIHSQSFAIFSPTAFGGTVGSPYFLFVLRAVRYIIGLAVLFYRFFPLKRRLLKTIAFFCIFLTFFARKKLAKCNSVYYLMP